MHLTEGSLSTVNIITTSGLGLCAFGIACWGSRKEISRQKLGFWSVMTGLVLLAQMVNFSTGLGFSGHFLGVALLTTIFGLWSAMLSVGLILIVQALFLGDGSITTLGVNFINMGVMAAGAAYFVFHVMQGRRRMLRDAGQLFAMALASYVSILVAALCLGLTLGYALGSLMFSYALIAFFEAFISVAIFYACARYKSQRKSDLTKRSLALPPLIFGVIAVLLISFSSPLPDALGRAIEMYTIGAFDLPVKL